MRVPLYRAVSHASKRAQTALRTSGRDIVPFHDAFADMQRLLGAEPRVIVDGGAHHGVVSRRFHALFPAATVYSFEPQSDTFRHLVENTRAYPAIRPQNLALSEEAATLRLFTNAFSATSSCSPASEAGREYFPGLTDPVGVEEIRAVRLDEWCAEQGVGSIDLLKLDLQGHELKALRGAEGVLDSVKLVYTEVEFVPIYQENALFHEVADFLYGKGFSLLQLYDLTSKQGQLVWGDAVFIRR
jgi:FkbM family methyltransferase